MKVTKNLRQQVLSMFAMLFAAIISISGASAGTLEDVKNRGKLICGVNPQVSGFSVPDENGVWQGFSIDLCQAISAAIGVETEYKPLPSTERFLALATGVADVLVMTNTWTMTRDTKLGVMFAATHYYDIQSFLVRKNVGASKIADLNGASACVTSGSTGETNLANLFKERSLTYKPITYKTSSEARLAYGSGRCDFIMGDQSNLANMRVQLKDSDAHTVLKDGIGREPLSLTVRQGDDKWFNIIRWTYYSTLIAELHGVTQSNADAMAQSSKSAEVKKLLGSGGGNLGEDLGLDVQFALRAIQKVGNYSEMFERHLGPNTPMGLPRALNALWVNGGIQYAPPFK